MCIDAGGIYGSRVLGDCGNGEAADTSSVSGGSRECGGQRNIR
ncbi:MAG: hypothetical protein ACLR7N_12330 [Roseburia hominis]